MTTGRSPLTWHMFRFDECSQDLDIHVSGSVRLALCIHGLSLWHYEHFFNFLNGRVVSGEVSGRQQNRHHDLDSFCKGNIRFAQPHVFSMLKDEHMLYRMYAAGYRSGFEEESAVSASLFP
jgi:hypothetical protein